MSGRTGKLALDIGGTSIKGAVLSGNHWLGGFTVAVDSDAAAGQIEAYFLECSRQGARTAGEHGLEITGIGAGVPGPFDYARGVSLMTHKYAAIQGMRLADWLRDSFGDIPIRFISDSAAMLRGSMLQLGLSCRNLCCVMLGTGLGFGCMVDGHMLETESGGPAVPLYARRYRDASAEDYVSKRAIMAAYRRRTGRLLEVLDIDRLAQQGDVEALAVFKDTGVYLAEILAPLVKQYGLECILLGGNISKAGSMLTLPLEARIAELGAAAAVICPPDIDLAPLQGAVAALSDEEP